MTVLFLRVFFLKLHLYEASVVQDISTFQFGQYFVNNVYNSQYKLACNLAKNSTRVGTRLDFLYSLSFSWNGDPF